MDQQLNDLEAQLDRASAEADAWDNLARVNLRHRDQINTTTDPEYRRLADEYTRVIGPNFQNAVTRHTELSRRLIALYDKMAARHA